MLGHLSTSELSPSTICHFQIRLSYSLFSDNTLYFFHPVCGLCCSLFFSMQKVFSFLEPLLLIFPFIAPILLGHIISRMESVIAEPSNKRDREICPISLATWRSWWPWWEQCNEIVCIVANWEGIKEWMRDKKVELWLTPKNVYVCQPFNSHLPPLPSPPRAGNQIRISHLLGKFSVIELYPQTTNRYSHEQLPTVYCTVRIGLGIKEANSCPHRTYMLIKVNT